MYLNHVDWLQVQERESIYISVGLHDKTFRKQNSSLFLLKMLASNQLADVVLDYAIAHVGHAEI